MDELSVGEHLSIVRDDEVGLWSAIAIDNTNLGPGLGGVRFASYATQAAAANEAQRLARGMTLKNALAGLPFGGAKSVILAHEGVADRDLLMQRFGAFVARLGGTYIPGVDMGTTDRDLQQMALNGATVSCAESDPSPWTASGVFAAMRAAIAYLTGDNGLVGVRVIVQGVGHVGNELVRLCRESGAEVLITDLDPARAATVAAKHQARVIASDAALTTEADIFAPCATAKVLDHATATQIPVRLVVGAANDTLADDTVAETLRARGICYVPDFLANAGGVVQIHSDREAWSRLELEAAIQAIGVRTYALLTETRRERTPLSVAIAQAQRVVRNAGGRRSLSMAGRPATSDAHQTPCLSARALDAPEAIQ